MVAAPLPPGPEMVHSKRPSPSLMEGMQAGMQGWKDHRMVPGWSVHSHRHAAGRQAGRYGEMSGAVGVRELGATLPGLASELRHNLAGGGGGLHPRLEKGARGDGL